MLLLVLRKWAMPFGLFFVFTASLAQKSLRIVSWNACNFGQSKSDSEIVFMANTLKNADIVAIQEVSSSYHGAQAVARLKDELGRKGAQWDVALSEPTNGPGSERYAFLWKPSKVKLSGKAWLENSLDAAIDREPFLARFEVNGKKILLCTIHAVPKNKEPAKECKHLYKINELYTADNLLIMGDFNLSEKNGAFNTLKVSGIVPSLTGQKTSLKMEPRNGENLANEYDNIFYEKLSFDLQKSGIIEFYTSFPTLKDARKISDHVPVYVEVIIVK